VPSSPPPCCQSQSCSGERGHTSITWRSAALTTPAHRSDGQNSILDDSRRCRSGPSRSCAAGVPDRRHVRQRDTRCHRVRRVPHDTAETVPVQRNPVPIAQHRGHQDESVSALAFAHRSIIARCWLDNPCRAAAESFMPNARITRSECGDRSPCHVRQSPRGICAPPAKLSSDTSAAIGLLPGS